MMLPRVIGGLFVAWLALASAYAGVPVAVTLTCPTTTDQANGCVTGTFTATGQSPTFISWGQFNIVFGGASGPNGSWNATIRIERSFNGGTTWYVAGVGGSGTQAIYNTPNQDVSVVVTEPEKGVLYRLNCSTYASGTIAYRISTTGGGSSHP